MEFRGSQVKVREFKVAQNSVVKLVNQVSFTDQIQNEIANVANTLAKNTVDTIQQTASDVGAPDSAQRVIQETQRYINSDTFTSNVKQNITTLALKVANPQHISLVFVDTSLETDTFVIEQNALLDLTSSNIINSTLNNLFKDERMVQVLDEVSTSLDKKQKGLSDTVHAAGDVADISFDMFESIGGVVVVALIVLGAWYYFMGRKSHVVAGNVNNATQVSQVRKSYTKWILYKVLGSLLGISILGMVISIIMYRILTDSSRRTSALIAVISFSVIILLLIIAFIFTLRY
jgi:hypothetical protein